MKTVGALIGSVPSGSAVPKRANINFENGEYQLFICTIFSTVLTSLGVLPSQLHHIAYIVHDLLTLDIANTSHICLH
jgi:hypothetical protein